MGMGLNGKELGEGIAQKKNGKYIARCRTKAAKKACQYYKEHPEAMYEMFKKGAE